MLKEHTKKGPTPLATGRCKLKPVRSNFTLPRIAKIKTEQTDNTKFSKLSVGV